MNILLLNLFIVYISSFMSRYNVKESKLENNYRKYNYCFVIIALLSLIIVSGCRYESGTDFWSYQATFKDMIQRDVDISENKDITFYAMAKFLATISNEPQFIFLVIAIIINVLIIKSLLENAEKFELSVYLYITTFAFYSTFNGLRQWIASAIIFSGFKYLKSNQWRQFYIITVLASLFHASALIMIPVYHITRGKFKSFKNIVMVFIFLAITLFYNGFLDGFFEVIGDTQYSEYTTIISASGEGVSILRFLVYLVPIIVSFLFYKNISNKEDLDYILNISLIGMLIMMVSLRHWIFARFSIYFDLYYILLIPKLTTISDKKGNRLIYYIIVICYFVYSIKLLLAGDSRILPYSMNFKLF